MKSIKKFKTIAQVAENLKLPQHVLRFWENRFKQLKPLKLSGNRRYYREIDIELIIYIKNLLYEDCLSIKGVQKIFDIHKNGYGKLGGRILDSLSAGLFVQLYDKAPDNIKEKMNKMNEKRLYIVTGKMWDKFGSGVSLR